MNASEKKLTVFGAGSWGTAIAIHLAKNHAKVTLWGRNEEQMADMQHSGRNNRYLPQITLPANLRCTADLAEATANSELFVVVVPSHSFSSFLTQLKPYYQPQIPLVWATKGIKEDGEFLHQVVENILGKATPKAVIAGPSFAAEVAVELPTAIVVASDQLDCANQVAQLLSSPRFRVYTSQDMIGAQLGGAVKNVLAIATGISDGLGFGANARSALITRGLAELMRLGVALGAQTETLMGLAGLGDLILTCTDDKSRNRRFGLALGKGISVEQAIADIGQVVEGATAAAYIHRLAQRYQVEMPITEQVYLVLNGQHPPASAVESLFSRELKAE